MCVRFEKFVVFIKIMMQLTFNVSKIVVIEHVLSQIVQENQHFYIHSIIIASIRLRYG